MPLYGAGAGAAAPASLWTPDIVAANNSTANYTHQGAAFTSDGTSISLTAGNTWHRAVWNTAAATPATVVVEAELYLPADWGADTAGIILGPANADGLGVSFRLDGTNSVRFERDGSFAYGVTTVAALALQTWHKFRFVRFGGEADGYVNGQRVLTSKGGLSADALAVCPGFMCYSSGVKTVRFRNLKTWALAGIPA